MKTRAAIVEARDAPLRIEEVDLADPVTGEVRVKIEACGICRSDLHAIDGGEDVTLPAVLGHEAAGVVEACGPSVEQLREGDRVVLSWTPACRRCPSCLRGEPQLCAGIRMSAAGTGPLTWNGNPLDRFMNLGAFCERVVVPEGMAITIEAEIPDTHACLIGCGVMTGFGAATKTADVGTNETVAVIGCGGVGLAAIQGARIAGASRIFAVDPLEARRVAAIDVGATDAVTADGSAAAVLADTAGGVDVAIECVGQTRTMSEAFDMIRPGGRAIVVGLPPLDARLDISALMLLFEKSIKGSMYGSADPKHDFPMLATLAADGELDLATLVSDTLPFAEINEGIAETRSGATGRVVLTF